MRLRDLLEGSELKSAKLHSDLANTLPPMFVMPQMQNSNGYVQYRHALALGVALAVERGEVEFDQQSAMNQMQTVICYTPQEQEILELTNKLMGVTGKQLSRTPSQEPDFVNKVSPVIQNTHSIPESMRSMLNRMD